MESRALPLHDPDVAELHGPDVAPPNSLWQLLQSCAKINPAGDAVVAMHQAGEHLSILRPRRKTDPSIHASWSFQELQEGAEILAQRLSAVGLGKGSMVALFIYNSIEWALFFWALANLGAVFIPLDPRFLTRSKELSHFLDILHPDTIVVWGESDAVALEDHNRSKLPLPRIRIICEDLHITGQDLTHWRSLSTVLGEEQELPAGSEAAAESISSDDVAVMMATSGSTSLPKLCPHTARSLGSCSSIYKDVRGLGPKQKFLVHSPSFHIMAVFALLCAWRGGAAGVFPSKQFESGATLKCLKDQGCTHFSVTPSMAHALINHPLFESCRPDKVKLINVGADIIPPEIMDLCRNQFRAETVVASWGMTEGVGLVYSGPGDIPPAVRGSVSIGKIMPGGRIRICEAGKTAPLARNQEGELHCGGSSMIPRYWNDQDADVFYSDECGPWLITGDRAYIDEAGNVFVTGRSKDLIIRGGENISPAMVEACLNGSGNITVSVTPSYVHGLDFTEFHSQSQVVGVPDMIAGEVPVAIIKPKSNADVFQDVQKLKSTLRQRVVRELGTVFSLSEVFMLDELGVNEFPLVSSGKIRKSELKDLVRRHMAHQGRKAASVASAEERVRDIIVDIWSNLLGLDRDAIVPTVPLTHLADSLTIMRFCHKIETSLNKKLSSSEIAEHDTVEKQVALIASINKPTSKARTSPAVKFIRPSVEDMTLTRGNLKLFEELKESVKPALQSLGMSWEYDVMTVHRMTEACEFWVKKSRTPSSNVRSYYEFENTSIGITEIRQALQDALARHDCLRTIFAESAIGPVQLVIRPNNQLFQSCIREELITIHTMSDLPELVHSMDVEFGGPPLPFYQARFVQVEDTGRIGLLQSIHHAVFDATSLGMFYEDFDALLQGSKSTPHARIPFKLFADNYHLHSESTSARHSVQYHVERIQGIETMEEAFWPKPRTSAWMTGTDHGWISKDKSKQVRQERPSFDRLENRVKGTILTHKNIRLASLESLKIKHSVEAPTLIQAAIALFNTETTRQNVAIFSNTIAARKWPFLQEWITDLLPNPMSIAGPTMERSINVIRVNPHETTLAFLQRLQKEQNEDMQHAHVPYSSVIDRLGIDSNLLDSLVRRQTFNWVHNMRKTHSQTFKVLKRVMGKAWMDFGFTWEFGLSEPGVVEGRCSYDDAHLRFEEVRGALDRIFELAGWLAEEGNWGVEIEERVRGGAAAVNGGDE